MKAAETTTIVYVKQNGELTERDIVLVDAPRDQVKAIDVTDWDSVSCSVVETLVSEYKEYKESQINKIFSFEDWLTHTGHGSGYGVKWRTFKLNGILEERPTTFTGSYRRK
jgi:predicted RNA-binding protein